MSFIIQYLQENDQTMKRRGLHPFIRIRVWPPSSPWKSQEVATSPFYKSDGLATSPSLQEPEGSDLTLSKSEEGAPSPLRRAREGGGTLLSLKSDGRGPPHHLRKSYGVATSHS